MIKKKAEIISEAVARLESISTSDSEDGHMYADTVLLDTLRSLGASDVATAWERLRERIGFWYA